MAIPVLKLNLAPPPTLWRRQHAALSWTVLSLGILALAIVGGLTWRAYHQAGRVGREAFLLSRKTQDSIARQGNIQNELKAINVQKELPRWRLAERILVERSSPWSRLTAELERSLVQDVRIRGIQRIRGNDQQVVVKLKGEARTRAAEADFVESVEKNAFFAQMILERETERQGSGVEFEFTLPLSATPPAYEPLPKFGPTRKSDTPAAPAPQPVKAKAAPLPARPITKAPTPPAAQRPAIATTEPSPQASPLRPTRDARLTDPDGAIPRRRPRPVKRPDQEVSR